MIQKTARVSSNSEQSVRVAIVAASCFSFHPTRQRQELLLSEVLDHFKLSKFLVALEEAGVESLDDLSQLGGFPFHTPRTPRRPQALCPLLALVDVVRMSPLWAGRAALAADMPRCVAVVRVWSPRFAFT